jgi:hypothetical protein
MLPRVRIAAQRPRQSRLIFNLWDESSDANHRSVCRTGRPQRFSTRIQHKNSMKIPHISPMYAPALGGAEYHLKATLEGLVGRGHEVTVFAANECLELDLMRVLMACRASPDDNDFEHAGKNGNQQRCAVTKCARNEVIDRVERLTFPGRPRMSVPSRLMIP